MKGPNDVKCDRDGRFVVADTFNHRISWYDSVSIFYLELALLSNWKIVLFRS